MLLMHGGADNSSAWIDTMIALSSSYTSYAPDIIGFGLSDKPKSGYYMTEFAEFTLSFIDALGLGTMALIGHSIGSRICLEAVLRSPERFTKMVLISSAGFCKLSRLGGFLGTAAWGVRKALRRPQPYPRFLIQDDEDKDWLYLDALPAIRVPTLVIWGDRDPYYPFDQAIGAKELLPNSRWEIIPGTGHAPHKQKPDTFIKLLLSFLSDQG